VKLLNWVLVKFKESKFCLNQSLKILNTVLMFLLKSVGCEWNNKMLVSSANRIYIYIYIYIYTYNINIILCTFIVILEQKRGESP